MRSTLAALCTFLVLASACAADSSDGTSPVSGARTVTLSATSVDPLTSAGETRELTARVTDGYQSVIAAPSIAWSSSAPTVATVVGTGSTATVTAVSDGSTIITAASEGATNTVMVVVSRRIVSIALSASDSILVAGDSERLYVDGLDARGKYVAALTGATFAIGNPFSVLVTADGLLTALYSSFKPTASTVMATVVRDGATLRASKRFEIASPAPARYDFFAILLPEDVQPEPVFSVSDGAVYLAVTDSGIDFTLLWSKLSGRPVGGHLHGPIESDGVAPVLADFPLGDQFANHGAIRGTLTAEYIRARDGRPKISVDSLVTLIRNSATYVDVHTAELPGGEIRGEPVAHR
jgi:hypothetical protein